METFTQTELKAANLVLAAYGCIETVAYYPIVVVYVVIDEFLTIHVYDNVVILHFYLLWVVLVVELISDV